MSRQPTIHEAVQLYKQGQREQAEALCTQILAATPNDRDVSLMLATLAIERGDTAQGIGILEQVVRREPAYPRVRHALGRALTQSGRIAEGILQLEEAVRLDPQQIDSWLELGGAHLRQQQPQAVEAVLRRALASASRHPAVLANLGSLMAKSGNAAEGVQLLHEAVQLAPQQPSLHFNLAIALKASDDVAGAERHYREAVALRPGYAEAWLNLGNLLLDLGRVEEAANAFAAGTHARRARDSMAAPPGDSLRTSRSKLQHDIEQFRYLLRQGKLPASFSATIADYETALADLQPTALGIGAVEMPPALRRRLAPTYNRLLYRPPAPAIAAGAINPRLDPLAIEADYHRNQPGMTFFDAFLSVEALEGLRHFCLEATVWFQARYANGYIGAFMDDGFCSPLLLQIAEELRHALPGIFGTHTLRKLWAFKYDSRLSGIPIHADFAAVNVNFWVTPDEANLDPMGGGLIVWDREAPLEWDFAKYNNDLPAIRRFLRESGARPTNVPHRQNRVVIFNSDLFHETAALKFRDGYENRRINITMLYGKRGG